MNIVLLLSIVCAVQYYTDALGFEDPSKCSPPPKAVTPQPTLDELCGQWYIYATNDPHAAFDSTCGTCIVKKDGSDYKMQCIFLFKYSSSNFNLILYLTGPLTFSNNIFTFEITHNGQKIKYNAVITKYDKSKCSIVAEMCKSDLNPTTMQTEYCIVQFGLVKKGPTSSLNDITSDKADVTQTGCLQVTFNWDLTEVFHEQTSSTTTRSPDKIPESCTELGFTAAGSRFVKYFAGPKTWADAKKDCECQGYTLATVDSDDALNAIKTLLNGQNTKRAWIGLKHTSQTASTGTYKWCDKAGTTFSITTADGNPVAPATFSKWCNGANTNYDSGSSSVDGLSCFILDVDNCATTFGWKEATCTDKKPYLCECNMCPTA